MTIGGKYCDGAEEYTFTQRTGVARKPHVCSECGENINVGEVFSWAIWGCPGQGGSSARRCQFCASFAEGYECVGWGALREALESAEYADFVDMAAATRDEVNRRFNLGFEFKDLPLFTEDDTTDGWKLVLGETGPQTDTLGHWLLDVSKVYVIRRSQCGYVVECSGKRLGAHDSLSLAKLICEKHSLGVLG